MDLISNAEKIFASGFGVFLIIILIAGHRRVWVWGHQLDAAMERTKEIQREKDAQIEYERLQKGEWRALALQTRELTERFANVTTKVVDKAR